MHNCTQQCILQLIGHTAPVYLRKNKCVCILLASVPLFVSFCILLLNNFACQLSVFYCCGLPAVIVNAKISMCLTKRRVATKISLNTAVVATLAVLCKFACDIRHTLCKNENKYNMQKLNKIIAKFVLKINIIYFPIIKKRVHKKLKKKQNNRSSGTST